MRSPRNTWNNPFAQTIMTTHPQKITFGEMRASGVRDVLIYCRDHRCSHHIAISADTGPIKVARKCGRSFRRPAWAFGKCSAAPFDEFDLFSLIKFDLLRLYSNSTCIAGIKPNADLKLRLDCAHSR
jgi:hypothetical protein